MINDNIDWFSTEDAPPPKKSLSKENKAKVKYDNIVCTLAESLEDIVGGELVDGIQYRIVTSKSFNAIVVIEYVLSKYEIEEIIIAVYRMNLKSVSKIKEIMSSGGIQLKILLSSFFRENKKYERWCENLLELSKDNKNTSIMFAWNHAKVFICKTKCGKHIVFEGSGNLSDNARIEQYILENNKVVYNFHKKWILDIFENNNSQQNPTK